MDDGQTTVGAFRLHAHADAAEQPWRTERAAQRRSARLPVEEGGISGGEDGSARGEREARRDEGVEVGAGPPCPPSNPLKTPCAGSLRSPARRRRDPVGTRD